MAEVRADGVTTPRKTTDPGSLKLSVLGSPIAHSRSPLIHAAAYRVLGLDWDYSRRQCEERELADFLGTRGDDWRGLSLTMPLKEEAHRLASVLDPVAEESGVVNTLLHLTGDVGWAGFNTDVGGLAAAISDVGLDATRTIVLGSGATAVSAVLAARQLGARHVEIVARNAEAVDRLVERFTETREPGATEVLHVSGTLLRHVDTLMDAVRTDSNDAQPSLIVSSLPGEVGKGLALPESLTRIPLFDVAYDPWPSPLAEHWRLRGGEAHSGLGMLVQQALLQVRIFLNGDPSVPVPEEDRVLAAMFAAISAEGSVGE